MFFFLFFFSFYQSIHISVLLLSLRNNNFIPECIDQSHLSFPIFENKNNKEIELIFPLPNSMQLDSDVNEIKFEKKSSSSHRQCSTKPTSLKMNQCRCNENVILFSIRFSVMCPRLEMYLKVVCSLKEWQKKSGLM